MSKKAYPYMGYNEQEVRNMEENFYLVKFGGDFIGEEGCYLFTKAEASKIYEKTLRDLLSIIIDGTNKDRNYALELVSGLIIQPMRLH